MSVLPRAVSAMLLTLSACQDIPTAVTPSTAVPADAVRSSAGGLHLGQSVLVCVLGRPSPAPVTGWQTRRDTIFVPRSEYEEGGQVVRYTLLQMAHDGNVAYTASCTAPYTEAALRRVDRHFRVAEGGGADQFRERQGMVATQGCVSDGMCAIEGLVVTAPPAPIAPNRAEESCAADPAACTPSESGGWDDGSGGDGSDPPSTYEEGPLLWAVCILGMVSSTASIGDVAGDFETWHKAYKDAAGAQRLWQAAVQNNADSYIQQLYEYQYRQARQRQADAAAAVSKSTNASIFTLAGAALACGATALIPVA